MRLLLLLVLFAGCKSSMKEAAQADALEVQGAWIGLDDSGSTWWRLQLAKGRRGRGGFETNGAVARYEITDWTSDAQGAVTVHMVRGREATALDRAPATISLAGRGDGSRLRLKYGKSEIVLLREESLLAARSRLEKRMAAD